MKFAADPANTWRANPRFKYAGNAHVYTCTARAHPELVALSANGWQDDWQRLGSRVMKKTKHRPMYYKKCWAHAARSWIKFDALQLSSIIAFAETIQLQQQQVARFSRSRVSKKRAQMMVIVCGNILGSLVLVGLILLGSLLSTSAASAPQPPPQPPNPPQPYSSAAVFRGR